MNLVPEDVPGLVPGGVPGSGGYLVWEGVPGPGGVPGPRGVYLVPGVYLVWGVYLVQGGVPGPGGLTWSGTPPPPCGQTHACKHITLPQTSFAHVRQRIPFDLALWKSLLRYGFRRATFVIQPTNVTMIMNNLSPSHPNLLKGNITSGNVINH